MKLLPLALLALGIFPIHANAEWTRSVVTDEMRQTQTVIHSNTVSPLNGTYPELSLQVMDSGDGRPTVIFQLERGIANECLKNEDRSCELNVRFDNGLVKSLSFAAKDGVIIPTRNGAFTGAVVSASVLYIEVPVGGTTSQYKYDLQGLEVNLSKEPVVTLLGFNLGETYPLKRPALEVSKTEGKKICYSGEGVTDVFPEVAVKEVTLCFYNDVFYLAIVDPGSKKSYDAGKKLMVKYFGKADPDSLHPSWPDNKGRLIEKNVKSAFYFGFKEADYSQPFIIRDDSFELLVPGNK